MSGGLHGTLALPSDAWGGSPREQRLNARCLASDSRLSYLEAGVASLLLELQGPLPQLLLESLDLPPPLPVGDRCLNPHFWTSGQFGPN